MKKFLSLFTAVLLTATAFGQDIQLNGTVSAENNQVKNVADPTEDQDAVTKAYADNLISNFGYQQWSENQVWNDNTTISPEPNSFWFINAENPTITLPPLANQGDVIKIYYMGAGINNFSEEHTVYIDAETNGVFMGFQGNSNYFADGFAYNFGGVMPFKIEYGLNEFIQIGDYWMLGELESRYDDFDFDNDGYSSDQGDCNDSDATIYPGATEILNGIDDDCDGSVDEDLCGNGTIDSGEDCDDGGLNDPASNCYECQYFEDADNDGFNAYFDCDDADASIYPGAAEILDGIDNDCDGTADDCPIEADFTGDYLIEEITPYVDGPTLNDGAIVTVTTVAGNATQRTFDTPNYINYCSTPNAFTFELNCGQILMAGEGIQCNCSCGGNLWFTNADAPTSYNPADDSSFEVSFTNDAYSDCNSPQTTTYRFIKL